MQLLSGHFWASCTGYCSGACAFLAGATAEQRLAALRTHLPTSLGGIGLRSMTIISNAAYFASMRAVAPSILAAALPETAAAIKTVSAETEDDASAAPMLRVAAICGRFAGAALSAEDAELADMASFCDKVPEGLQRKDHSRRKDHSH